MDFNKLLNILFYARKVIAVPSGDVEKSLENASFAMTAVKNLSDYGFIPDENGIKMLVTASNEAITDWYYATEKKLNEMAGGNHVYKPFYPNFPEEVIEKSELELFIDQITHYITVAIGDIFGETNVGWMPEGVNEKENKKSLEEHPLKVFTTIGENDNDGILKMATSIFKNTINTKLTPSSSDTINIINAYIDANPNWTNSTTVIENRKVLSYLYAVAVMDGKDVSKMPKLITNDYLRVAQVYSVMEKEGVTRLENVDIQKKSEYGKAKEQRVTRLSRAMRKFIANGLEGQKNLEEDIDRYKSLWKEMFRMMHISTMKNIPHLSAVAQKVRNNVPLNTFNSRINKALHEERYEDVVKMYASRPGEFIKALNRMIVMDIEDEEKKISYVSLLLEKSQEVFEKSRPEDLIRLITYLRARTREDMIPVHNVKGTFVQTEKVHDTLLPETANVFIKMAQDSIMKQIDVTPYNKVYIDSMLEKMPLPTEISDTTGKMNAYPRGSRLPIEKDANGNPKNLRIFVWWTNQERNDYDARVDLDLSVNLYKEVENGRTQHTGSVAYHSGFKFSTDIIVHSGDITDGGPANGDGVCEYIDVNLRKLQALNTVDYVQIYINSFTGQPFNKINCLGGWQEREELDKSKQFDVRAVKQVSDMNRNCTGVTMAILDVKNAEIIWVDSPDNHAKTASNSIDAVNGFDLLMERYTKGDQTTMKELAEMVVVANGGTIVDSIADADVIFSVDEVADATPEQKVITAKDQDIWVGELMSPKKPEEEEVEVQEETEDVVVEKKPKSKSIAELIAETSSTIHG